MDAKLRGSIFVLTSFGFTAASAVCLLKVCEQTSHTQPLCCGLTLWFHVWTKTQMNWTPRHPPPLTACTEAHLSRGQPTSHRAYNGSLWDAKYSTEPTLSLRAPRRPLDDKHTASVGLCSLFTTSFLNGTRPGHVNTPRLLQDGKSSMSSETHRQV